MQFKTFFIAIIFLFCTKSFAEGSEDNVPYHSDNVENKSDNLESHISDDAAALHKKVLDLEEKVRELNGKIQYSDYTNRKIIEKINNLASDINYRFSTLEGKEIEDKAIDKENASSPDKIARYSNMVGGKNYKEAAEGLMKFIKVNHNRIDLDEAYYLLARAYMGQGLYDKAGTYFLKNYKYYPNKLRASESLLNLARSLAKLEKYNRACAILARLEKEYPNRSEEEHKLSYIEKKNIKCR